MVDYFSMPAIFGYLCFFGILGAFVIIFFVPGIISGSLAGKVLGDKYRRDMTWIKQEIAEISKYKQDIFVHGGVVAPGVIVSAHPVKSWGGDRRHGHPYHLVDFEADVAPEGKPQFRAKFRNEIHRDSYVILGNEITTEHGRKIWVTYDPMDVSRAYLDHFDEDHESAMKEREIDTRRAEFNQLTSGNEDLKINGEPAEAVITRVDDLNLPYPLKKSRAMHLYFEVHPAAGLPFQAEGDVLIVETSLQKYSVGKKVFVRYDKHNPKWAILDSERNKSLT